MPIHRGFDSAKGRPFYQWGNRAKYFYTAGDRVSAQRAKNKAHRQEVAIYASGWMKK